MMRVIALALASLGLASPPAPPEPGELLLDMQVREAWLKRWAPLHGRFTFRAPSISDLADPELTPHLEVHAVPVAGPGGEAIFLGPVPHLDGVERGELRLPGGRVARARVYLPEDRLEVPFARLVPEGGGLGDVTPLAWAPDDQVVDGARGWLVERPGSLTPEGQLPRPVLVDTVLGPKVEPPLERLRYVGAREAPGLPVLDASGRVLCVVVRDVPGLQGTSLCAPREAALSGLPPAP